MYALSAIAILSGTYISFNSASFIASVLGGFGAPGSWRALPLNEAYVYPFTTDPPLVASAIAQFLIARWGIRDRWSRIQLGGITAFSAAATLSWNALHGPIANGQLVFHWPAALFASLVVSAIPGACIVATIHMNQMVLSLKRGRNTAGWDEEPSNSEQNVPSSAGNGSAGRSASKSGRRNGGATKTERVRTLLTQGLPTEEVAARTGAAPSTVRKVRSAIQGRSGRKPETDSAPEASAERAP